MQRQKPAMSEAQFSVVAAVSDVPEGHSRAVAVGARSILLCNDGGEIFALENLCPHAGMPLEGGRVRAGFIACPFHGSRFDLESGCALNPPASEPVATFPVRIEGGSIAVAV